MWSKRAVALGASVMLALGVVSLGPASADPETDKKKVDAAVEAAGDDLRAANAEVEKAIADLQEVRQLLPAARKELAEAREDATVAEEADRAAQAELEQATAAAIRAEQERAEVEFQIQDLQSRVGNLARAVYQNGAFADFDLLITAQSPTDLSDRAQALDAVSRANNQTLSQMAGIRAELALKEARLEVLRQEVDDKRQQAAIALSEANIARDRAAAAKLKVDLLVAQKATALDVAASERAKVLKQYKSYQAEQQRIAALLAKQAAAEAARLAAGGSLSFVPTDVEGFRWPIEGVQGRPGRRAARPPGVRLSLVPHRGRPRRPQRDADPGHGRRDRCHQRHRWPVRQPHPDLPRQRAVLDVRPPVAVRGRGGADGQEGRRDRLRRQHRLLHGAAPALRDPRGRDAVRPAGMVRGRRQGTGSLLMPREKGRRLVAQNKKARHDYHIDATWEAGIVLVGTEVKSLRAGRASIVDAFAQFSDGELFLHGLHIPEYAHGTWTNHAPRRVRKLLMKRAELDRLERKLKESGYTLVPLSLYFKDGYAKVEIALARGKKAYDKRQTLAERDANRDIAKEMGRHLKGRT